jgi:transposase
MSRNSLFTDLLGIQGWRVGVGGVRLDGEDVIVSIEPSSVGHRCGWCGQGLLFAYDHSPMRRIRDFPMWGRRYYLEVTLARVDCPDCGVGVEGLDWVDRYARHTIRYEKYVAQLCDLLPATDVAELESLSNSTVYRIDKKWLELRDLQREQPPVRYLGIDEISLKKGHRYATVFYDLERRTVVGLTKSRRERAVGGFFRKWGRERCRKVEAVCMDLWTPYLNSAKRHLKNAAVVFDKFHVYKYLSEAIEEVRRHEQAICSDEEGKLIKGTRWLWLKAKGNLKRNQKHTLDEIMAVNKRLQRAYLLKEDFEAFYQCEDKEEATSFLKQWTKRCTQGRLEPFIKLAKRLNRWSEGILTYFDHRITNGVAEGINNKIKVLKRRSYGFHDEEYFFLKILNACGALPSLDTVNHPQNS